jgi:large subunit ribosomal protein L3
MRGLIGQKLGMTQFWREDGKVIPVTVIQGGPCVITQIKTEELDGYSSVQLGIKIKKSRVRLSHRLDTSKKPILHLNTLFTNSAIWKLETKKKVMLLM